MTIKLVKHTYCTGIVLIVSKDLVKCNTIRVNVTNTKITQRNYGILINKSIGKMSNKNCIIDKIRVGNVEHVEPKEIANELCNYYSNIGAKLANSIPP